VNLWEVHTENTSQAGQLVPSPTPLEPVEVGSPFVATRIRWPSANELCDLTTVVSMMHRKRVVHRDLRPYNWYRDRSGRFFLGDFGSAQKIGEVGITYAHDTRPFGSNFGPLTHLRALANAAPLPDYEPKHDFEQIARVAFSCCSKYGDVIPSRNRSALVNFWERHDVLEPLRTLLLSAQHACEGPQMLQAFQADIRKFVL